MKEEIKTQHLRIALGLAGINASDIACETILKVIQDIEKKGGNFSIMDAVKIEKEIQDRKWEHSPNCVFNNIPRGTKYISILSKKLVFIV